MKKRSWLLLILLGIVAIIGLSACGSANEGEESSDAGQEDTATEETEGTEESESGEEAAGNNQEVNLYTSRHYDTDEALYEKFTEETGIEVNIISGSADELIERLEREGENTEGDVFITADAGRLHRAKEAGILQQVESDVLSENIPEKYRDKDNQWFGLTKRARILVYDPERVDEEELSTYEDLAADKWEGRVLVRSSDNIYNQSLVASLISINGTEETKAWADGLVENMGRDPQGGDRDQAKGIAAGEGDVAIMNSYYLGQMLNSSEEEEVKVAESLEVFFPNQETTGTHVNVSGAGVVKNSTNQEAAVQFIEFLSSEDVQAEFSEANYEYPVNPNVEPSELLQSWGDFEEQDINLTRLGENNTEALMLMNEAGWK
ncbi:Fe(3+) ABC transporter substrate-binding protein [Alteribacillus iranensis]|uniref:Iron(III) transport system substrate-binding protein n=1 Tax=Alteribacillus iranensis TaxID=930128 RepID=A0A1I2C2U1_9BACI|nr:Fe(3+) ABC transporter substrate-binding protein [Alteribacillus iranensis]SFE62488.1 iron(III) transport system substrate-binding protein [Alteribacillus iranensis]